MGIDISAVMTVHTEGYLSGVSINSVLKAMEYASTHSLNTEFIVVLDKPDKLTKEFIADLDVFSVMEEVEFGDQGKARNHAVGLCSGDYIAFNDADDLWSENWLVEAHKLVSQNPNYIVHPEINYFFQENGNLFFHIDQTDPGFNPRVLRFLNCWDALCLTKKEVYEKVGFSDRDIEGGFAYEDWQWNCETLEMGYIHRVAENTIHFKRRRKNSQTIKASARKSLIKRTQIFDYDWK